MAIAKDNENANARPSRISTRSKPVLSAATATATIAGGTSRATAGTAASRAKVNANADSKAEAPAGKRKREALGELTGLVTNNKLTGVVSRGKEKDDLKKDKFDGVVIKSKTTIARQPLRTVAGTRQATKTVSTMAKLKEGPEANKAQDENAMIVDSPAQTLPSITVRRSIVAKETAAADIRRSDAYRRASTRSVTVAQQAAVEDAEASRVFKKRRTSSDAPEEDLEAMEEARLRAEEEEAAVRIAAEMESFAEEPEADPEGSQWDDLDADDIDDPLMVSEYVVEIFNFLKQVEVGYHYVLLSCLISILIV